MIAAELELVSLVLLIMQFAAFLQAYDKGGGRNVLVLVFFMILVFILSDFGKEVSAERFEAE